MGVFPELFGENVWVVWEAHCNIMYVLKTVDEKIMFIVNQFGYCLWTKILVMGATLLLRVAWFLYDNMSSATVLAVLRNALINMHQPSIEMVEKRNTVETLDNTVNFCWNTHKRHSIARPKRRGMGCLLWVHRATYCVDLSKLSSIKYLL